MFKKCHAGLACNFLGDINIGAKSPITINLPHFLAKGTNIPPPPSIGKFEEYIPLPPFLEMCVKKILLVSMVRVRVVVFFGILKYRVYCIQNDRLCNRFSRFHAEIGFN